MSTLSLEELAALPTGTPLEVEIILFGEPVGTFSTRVAKATERSVALAPIEGPPHLRSGATIGAAIGLDSQLFYGRAGDDPHLGWFFYCRVRLPN